MFANRSIRLLLLASTAIPATLALGVSKMATSSTAAEMQVQQQPAAIAQAGGCAKKPVDIYFNNANAWTTARNELRDRCAPDCDPDYNTLVPARGPAVQGSTPVHIRDPFYAGGFRTEYHAFCKDKPIAAPAPALMNPKPPADVQLQAE